MSVYLVSRLRFAVRRMLIDDQNVYGINPNNLKLPYQIQKMKVQEVVNIVRITVMGNAGRKDLNLLHLLRQI
jgi:hypothetical protein